TPNLFRYITEPPPGVPLGLPMAYSGSTEWYGGSSGLPDAEGAFRRAAKAAGKAIYSPITTLDGSGSSAAPVRLEYNLPADNPSDSEIYSFNPSNDALASLSPQSQASSGFVIVGTATTLGRQYAVLGSLFSAESSEAVGSQPELKLSAPLLTPAVAS